MLNSTTYQYKEYWRNKIFNKLAFMCNIHIYIYACTEQVLPIDKRQLTSSRLAHELNMVRSPRVKAGNIRKGIEHVWLLLDRMRCSYLVYAVHAFRSSACRTIEKMLKMAKYKLYPKAWCYHKRSFSNGPKATFRPGQQLGKKRCTSTRKRHSVHRLQFNARFST